MSNDDGERETMEERPGVQRWAVVAAVCAVAVGGIVGLSESGHAGDDESETDQIRQAQNGVEDRDGWLHDIDYHLAEGETEIDDLRSRIIADLEGAEQRIDAAISDLDDTEIEQALLEAARRGIEVRVVADEEYRDDPNFGSLVEDDHISVVFGDGELGYLPEPNLSPLLEHCRGPETHEDSYGHDDYRECTRDPGNDQRLQRNTDNLMIRPANYNTMSHTFFVIDETEMWNVNAPLTDDQSVWPAFRAMSEELSRSFRREFRQMHGGVFSTTLSVYNGPLKSITQQHPMRLTNRGQLRVRFNPQERLVKNVVDETYRARSSVWVMTENLTNEDLVNALKYKQDNGFDVRVMVGQSRAEAPDLDEEIESLDPVEAPADMGRLPTMVVVDAELDRHGNRQPRTVQLLSHDLWHAQPFEVIVNTDEAGYPGDNDWVRFYPSDTFADGVMWELVESGYDEDEMVNPELDRFVETWNEMWNEAQ